VIRLPGVLATSDHLRASVGPHRLEQAAGESVVEFEQRVLAIAAEAGVEFVVIAATPCA
jgi:hypothetical protein